MSYTNGLDNPSLYFNTKLYTGNGSTQSINGIGFQPDATWIKARSGTYGTENHNFYNAISGATKFLIPNGTSSEGTDANSITSFDSDGFSAGTRTDINGSSTEYVAWNWLASNTTASNTDGSITSTVSANTTSGFSIVSYTGNGSTNQSVGHGLSQTPEILITKGRTNVQNWAVYGSVIGTDNRLYLNTTDAVATISGYLPADTSSVINLSGTSSMSNINTSSIDYITYAFHSVKGYSKIGSYTGNGSSDGTFVYTGFKPAFLILKRYDSTNNWYMYNNKVNPYNETDRPLKADTSESESTIFGGNELDFLSNGFKLRDTLGATNASGASYIYMCFAENPFVTSTSIPCTAR